MSLDEAAVIEMVRDALRRVHDDHTSTGVTMCMKDGTPVAMMFFTPLCMEEEIIDAINSANKRHRHNQPRGTG